MAEKQFNKHSKNFIDLTGRRFGRLTVIKLHPKRGSNWSSRWICRCDCGRKKILRGTHLTYSGIKSCVCLQREWARDAHTTHGLSNTREYRAWRSAKDRCFRPKCKAYEYYGARGITMCDEWRNDFPRFLADMGPCPKGLTLERRSVNGNYEPKNCYWATQTAQARNKRSNLYATHNGETLNLGEWAARTGINYFTLRHRYRDGRPLFAPVAKR